VRLRPALGAALAVAALAGLWAMRSAAKIEDAGRAGFGPAAPAPAAPRAEGDLERSAELIRRSLRAYDALEGYQAVFAREELEGDGSWDREATFLKFDKPFTIFMGWTDGEERGRQILYSEGNFDGKMMVRVPGFFNLIPLIPLSPDDPRILRAEKHPITSAGIGHFLQEFAQSFEESKGKGAVRVLALEETEAGGEPCVLLDVHFQDPAYEYPRTAVAFSRRHGLPVEVRLYRDGSTLVEAYRYEGLIVNPGSDDAAFKAQSDGRLFNLYQKIARAG
jgi:hypothetical protein